MGNWFCRFMDALFIGKEREVLAQLPQELIDEVLMWLPVKSLMRFRCVSKSFCKIIESKHFIYSHLNRSAKEKSHLNLIFETFDQIVTNNGSVISESGVVKGYCNGIFLLLFHECKLGLWNPSTHQTRILPCFPLDPNYFLDFSGFGMGLGYDSFRDDYKVVVIEPFSYLDTPAIVEYQVWVFELRSNTWRRVRIDFQPYLYGFTFGCFAHGDLHWLCGNEGDHWKIAAFDLAKETLSIIATPTCRPIEETESYLHASDGRIFMSFFTNIVKDEARLYVRKKDEAKFGWSLLYSVTTDQLPSFISIHNFIFLEVYGFSKEGDKIIMYLGLKYVVSYDIKGKCFRQTDVTLPVKEFLYAPLSFVESLVSVHASDQEGNQIGDGIDSFGQECSTRSS